MSRVAGPPLLERWFHLSALGTSVRTEVVAGTTTFLTLAYIIFVQPVVLSACGMDFGAVFVATCLATAVATTIMAVTANYPIAVAPAMGHNFFFAYTVVLGMHVPWRVALGAVALAGVLFILTAGIGLRERVITAIPDSLKHAIGVGIGLLVATLGLEWAGIIVASSGTLVTLGSLRSPPTLLAILGIAVASVLMVRGVRGATLAGMAVTTVVGWWMGLVTFQGMVGRPPSLMPTLLQLDVLGALRPAMAPVILVFLFLALFDSVGTLVGVADQAGLMKEGMLPRARQALLADAIGTTIGAGLGTSTVTAYVESAAGVAAGGRTGLASLVTAMLCVGALFFRPLVEMVGGGYRLAEGGTLYPIIAPTLILVGAMMMRGVGRIRWDDMTEAVPAFLTIAVMPLAVSITDGISFGLITYPVLKVAAGRPREVPPLAYVFGALLLARYLFLRS